MPINLIIFTLLLKKLIQLYYLKYHCVYYLQLPTKLSPTDVIKKDILIVFLTLFSFPGLTCIFFIINY